MRIPIDHRASKGALILIFITIALFIFLGAWGFLGLFILAGHLAFFRDPCRKVPPGKNIISPSDGYVAEITTVFEDRYLKEECVRIGLFLSVFIPHVNRAPVAGKVEYISYEPGKFLNALNEESTKWNESNWVGIQGAKYKVLYRQIAGAIARRIHCDLKVGQEVTQGQKAGIICYGSRVECYIPSRAFTPKIKMGQYLKAGESILGEERS